jgi:hypothetical protein
MSDLHPIRKLTAGVRAEPRIPGGSDYCGKTPVAGFMPTGPVRLNAYCDQVARRTKVPLAALVT